MSSALESRYRARSLWLDGLEGPLTRRPALSGDRDCDVAIVGDEDAVGAQISALAEAGVTDFVAGGYGSREDAARTHAFLRSLLS